MSQQLHWCGQVPTTTSSTVPFQMTTTGVGPVDLGKAGLEFGVDYFSTRRQKGCFTHSVSPPVKFSNKIYPHHCDNCVIFSWINKINIRFDIISILIPF